MSDHIVRQPNGEPPFVVAKDNTLIYGHYEKAKALGWETVAAYIIDADPNNPQDARKLRWLRRKFVAEFGSDDAPDDGFRVIDEAWRVGTDTPRSY